MAIGSRSAPHPTVKPALFAANSSNHLTSRQINRAQRRRPINRKQLRFCSPAVARPSDQYNRRGSFAGEFDGTANAEPNIPHPRWSQATEKLIDTGERRPTLPYNGYGEWVAKLYT